MRYRPAVPAEADAVLSLVADGRAALRALDIDQWQGGNPTAELNAVYFRIQEEATP